MTVYIDKAGWRVEANRTPEGVDFHQEGGGFVYSMPTEKFDELFTLAPEKTWRRGTVTAEFLGEGVKLACWTDGSLWNGFGTPYFERDVVDRLISLGTGPLAWEGDNLTGDEDGLVKPVTLPNGLVVWGVGAGYWCWDAVEFEKVSEDEAPKDQRRLYALDERQHATMLAALRYYQRDLTTARTAGVHDIATNSGKFVPLEVAEVDALIMDLNHDGLGPGEVAKLMEAGDAADR